MEVEKKTIKEYVLRIELSKVEREEESGEFVGKEKISLGEPILFESKDDFEVYPFIKMIRSFGTIYRDRHKR